MRGDNISSEYKIPDEYYFRLHHVRPRFKGDIENVLIYVAEEIARVGEMEKREFVKAVDSAIYRYPGNANKTEKTIKNWRTEISALFGFIQHTDNFQKPGRRAIELAQHQDLVECFKVFLYNFQYPGAHIKPGSVQEQIEYGIKFKPAQYILKLLRYANKDGGNSIGITKFEVCHCIFNDLRVTRDDRDVAETWELISENRNNRKGYDQTGDVIRYAGDIIDYMEIANLLKTYDSYTYYLNTLEEEAIIKFCESDEWFSEYDRMINQKKGNLEEIKECTNGWFEYVNRDMTNTDFSTDILAYIASDEEELQLLKEETENAGKGGVADLFERDEVIEKHLAIYYDLLTTKDIGDIGENLVHGHECMRVKLGGREDLIRKRCGKACRDPEGL